MITDRAIDILKNEIKCVSSNCDRDCANCSLVKTEEEIVEALKIGIDGIRYQSQHFGGVIKQVKVKIVSCILVAILCLIARLPSQLIAIGVILSLISTFLLIVPDIMIWSVDKIRAIKDWFIRRKNR